MGFTDGPSLATRVGEPVGAMLSLGNPLGDAVSAIEGTSESAKVGDAVGPEVDG